MKSGPILNSNPINSTDDSFHPWSSFSLVPQRVQHLHSMHCHGYSFTLTIMLCVNCRHVGWPGRRSQDSLSTACVLDPKV